MNKKILLSALICAAVASITVGCEKKEEGQNNQQENNTNTVETKKLTCTMTDEDKTRIRYTLTFEGDNSFSKASVMVTNEYSSEKATSTAYDKLKEEVKTVNEGKGVSANAQSSGKTVTGSYTFTVSELDDKGKKTYEEAGLKEIDGKKYDDIKTTLTSAGFSCN